MTNIMKRKLLFYNAATFWRTETEKAIAITEKAEGVKPADTFYSAENTMTAISQYATFFIFCLAERETHIPSEAYRRRRKWWRKYTKRNRLTAMALTFNTKVKKYNDIYWRREVTIEKLFGYISAEIRETINQLWSLSISSEEKWLYV